ncbi:MAG: hypothetical protein IJ887_01115 [Prevotella sp.]|nr:hypothetical protein [Prevotella sp.]
MEKKVYIRPIMMEVKIKTIKMLAESLPKTYSEQSSKASYSRESSSGWDDED